MRTFNGIDVGISGNVILFCPQNQRTICSIEGNINGNHCDNQEIFNKIGSIISQSVEISQVTVESDCSIASYALKSNITLAMAERIYQKVKATFDKFQITLMMAK